VVESAILFIHADLMAMDSNLLDVATGSRGVEEIAESSRFAMNVVSIWRLNRAIAGRAHTP
jgi:hypothetical protein